MSEGNQKNDIDGGSTEESVILDLEDDGSEDQKAPIYERRENSEGNDLRRAIFNVPIEVVVAVGTARPQIGELLSMGRNHLLPLDSAIDDPVELRVKDQVIARGELTQAEGEDGQLGVKLTEIVRLSDIVG